MGVNIKGAESDALADALVAGFVDGGRPRREVHAVVPVRELVDAYLETHQAEPSFVGWFMFGAYAGAGIDRAAIVREAVERGEAIVGRELPKLEIFVIGDTPLDIDAAHAVGCTAIAVATGHHDRATLRDAGADHVLETLEDRLPLE